ncbi:MAG: hypothetical protein M1833_004884 [Piccolia ochrophora]|nr:MAG: hypothetical protein M1833_004884 [Piccolia ochrophora]
MAEQKFVESLEDLTGRIFIVTGGAAGIGLETTIYLASKGATVYVASRNAEKCKEGIASAKRRLAGLGGPIHFHHLDLSSIAGATASALEFKKIASRLDVIVCNAGINMTSLDTLSKDGYETMFATNHLGHFTFVTSLLDLLEQTARAHGEARIVVTSSTAYLMSSKLDYESLTKSVPDDMKSIWDIKAAFTRYASSKLANVYFTAELDRRLREKSVQNIYCNSCHPGIAPNTGLGAGGPNPLGPLGEKVVRKLFEPFANSLEDSAKTQVHLAASQDVRERKSHGEHWMPRWSWTRAYKGCRPEALTSLGKNEQEQKKLWQFSEQAVQRAFGS